MCTPRKFERQNVSRTTSEFNLQPTRSCVMISMNWRVIFGDEMDQHNTRRAKVFLSLVAAIKKWAASLNASHSFIHLTTGSRVEATGRLMRATRAKIQRREVCIGIRGCDPGSYLSRPQLLVGFS